MSSISLGIVSPQSEPECVVTTRSLHIWFGKNHILKNIHADFLANKINGIVGPSGSGKLDEPTSSLDPVSARAIEDLMVELKQNYTIILVTHNIQQANRIVDHLIFLCDGQLIEQGSKEKLFSSPKNDQTKKYLNEEFCDCD